MEFLRSVLMQRQTITASATIDLVDLPVNPISHLLFSIECLNDTGTLTNYSVLNAVMAQISKVEVLYKGNSVLSGSLQDLAMMAYFLTGVMPGQVHQVRTNNDRRTVTFVLPFGRKLFWGDECFPATTRGEFQFRFTAAAAQTGIDGLTYTLESVELLNANPKAFTRITSFTGTQSSTGEHDLDLPRGNAILGVGLFATTIGATVESANTVRDARILIDNKEAYYQRTNWDSLHGEVAIRRPTPFTVQHHTHAVDVSDTPGTYRDSLQPELSTGALELYSYLDFDPLQDGSYALMTEGRGRIALRCTFGATDAMRYLPIELQQIAGVQV